MVFSLLLDWGLGLDDIGHSQPGCPLELLGSFKEIPMLGSTRESDGMVWGGDWAEVLFYTIILSSLDLLITCNSTIDQEGRPRWAGKGAPYLEVLAQQGPQQYTYLQLQKGQRLQASASCSRQGDYPEPSAKCLKVPPTPPKSQNGLGAVSEDGSIF